MSTNSTLCKQPVVAVVGHVDHGKTTLLDYIRKSSVATKETGGITQRIGAYEVIHMAAEGPRAITFIDTPGHEAFQKMRARAGAAADIAVLVIAADDGVKPQTLEAYKAIMDAKIPFVVAFTKIDKDTANIERAKESVMKAGIYLEGLGGDISFAGVSGKTGAGVPELLDLILLATDLHDISCDSAKDAEAIVIETSRDARSGISATIIVRQGTLKTGGFAVAGSAIAPLRTLEDFMGAKVTSISCGKPARISGFSEEPRAGAILTTVTTKKEAEGSATLETRASGRAPGAPANAETEERVLFRVALKADSAGSLEALEHEIGKIPSDKVEVRVVARGIGPISDNDIKPLIGFSPMTILGFNVKVDPSAKDLAERQHITLETRSIIYEASDWLKEEVKKCEPPVEEDTSASAEILRHFSTSGSKHVVGGKVTIGPLRLQDRVVIMRRGIEVGPGRIVNLQRDRADVSAVPEGAEFGAQIESKVDIVTGDVVKTASKKI